MTGKAEGGRLMSVNMGEGSRGTDRWASTRV